MNKANLFSGVVLLCLCIPAMAVDYSSKGKGLPAYYPASFSKKAVIQAVDKNSGIYLVVEGVTLKVDAFAKIALLTSESGNLYDLHQGMAIGYEVTVSQQGYRAISYIWELPQSMVPPLP